MFLTAVAAIPFFHGIGDGYKWMKEKIEAKLYFTIEFNTITNYHLYTAVLRYFSKSSDKLPILSPVPNSYAESTPKYVIGFGSVVVELQSEAPSNKKFNVYIERKFMENVSMEKGNLVPETMILSAVYTNRNDLLKYIDLALKEYREEKKKNLTVYTAIRGGTWTPTKEIGLRKKETLYIPQKTKDLLFKDIERFFENEAKYASVGQPFKRGYLLHGPPGTGKTSLVHVIASESLMDIYLLNLASPFMNDDQLKFLLQSIPSKSVILLEDIDAAWQQNTRNQLTKSGILNALDGFGSYNGSILIMTSNHPELLEERLKRPGRIDLQIDIDVPQEIDIRQMVRDLFPNCDNDLENSLVVYVQEKGTLAALSNLISYKQEELNAVIA